MISFLMSHRRTGRGAAPLAMMILLASAAPGQGAGLLSQRENGRGWNVAPAISRAGEPELRARISRFDSALLADIARAFVRAEEQRSFVVEVFDDLPLKVKVVHVETYGATRFVIHGVVAAAGSTPAGTMLLSVVDGVLQGEINTADGRKFAIDHLDGATCRISEINAHAASFSCATNETSGDGEALSSGAAAAPDPTSFEPQAPSALSEVAAAEDDGAVVDIMIVYTDAILRSFSGRTAMQAHCQLAVSSANTMFANSAVAARVRLVHTAQVDYAESGDVAVDLARLNDPADGFMDVVASLREQYRADVVHLFGASGTSGAGMATGYPSDYHAVLMGGSTTTFVHELGHNFGCQHDRAAAGSGGSSYGFGHVFTANDGGRYGCVMSYTGNAGASRIHQFSNPDVSFKGTPTGVPKGRPDSADNARIIDATAPLLASHRTPDGSSSRVPVFANPPRARFPITPAGATSAVQNIVLTNAAASRLRPLEVRDFQITGDASAFIVQIYDPTTRQYISGNSFTIQPTGGIILAVRFRPLTNNLAEANITFTIHDPAHIYSPPPIRLVGNASATALKNISTRVHVGEGENALIGGFIIGGSWVREVLVRAVGPSLEQRAVARPIADPTLELYRGADLVGKNDDWTTGFPRESIKWTGAAPTRDLESAILMRLDPGSYTAVVRGFAGGTGVGLVEAFDLENNSEAEVANISTRGEVRSGDEVMIGGFILGGGSSRRMLVRALGPSLTSGGVSGTLPDPVLDLHDSQGARLASNDNWRSDQEQEINGTGIAPEDHREAATLQTLPPGAYTAVVRGAGETTGVALVEVYKLQP